MEATVFYLLMLKNIYEFQANDSERKPCTLCLGNILKYFTANNMKKNWIPADYNIIGINDIINIDKYFMKKHNIT